MKKGLRTLGKSSNLNSLMGGVNIGIVRKPLQPKHGVPQTVKMPKLGPLAMPVTKASLNNLGGGKNAVTGNLKAGKLDKGVKNGKERNKQMGGSNVGKVKFTEKSDDKWDKKHGIKEGSKMDKKLDAKRGLPEKPKKHKRLSAVAKETRMLKHRMKHPAPYA